MLSQPAGIDCGATCSAVFSEGVSVTLSATPAADARFAGWSGACSGSGACEVSMSQARSVSANFLANPRHTLNVNKNGQGQVVSNPPGIDCGGDCSEDYEENTQVTLSALPAAGFTFDYWSGACGGNAGCVVQMTGARMVTAVFRTSFPLNVSKSGPGGGRVVSAPAGIDCGESCSALFREGVNVALGASPAAGSRFSGWSGDCSGSEACNVSMSQARHVAATFMLIPRYILSVAKEGGQGQVISNPLGIDCGGDCDESYEENTDVTLSALPASGFAFDRWSGACGGNNTCVTRMSEARSVTAVFRAIPAFPLSVSKPGAGGGTVTSAPAGISCGPTCTANFDEGTLVTLNAAENAGSRFDGWTGACTNSAGVCEVTMNAAKSVSALFSLAPVAGDVLMAGAAKQHINPTTGDLTNASGERDSEGLPQFFNLGGYGTKQLEACGPGPFSGECLPVLEKKSQAQGIYQDNHVRALVLKRGNTQLAFVNIDAIGAGNIILDSIRAAVNTATGIPKENVIIGETHSHSAADLQGLWGGVPTRWRNELYAKAAQTVKAAQDALTPAALHAASGQVNFNNYRRPKGDDPANPAAKYVTDKQLSVIQLRRLDTGAVIGTLSQYSAHPTILGDENRLTHTDYVLSMHEKLEQTYGGSSVYFNGVICDASPRAPSAPDGYERARLMGIGLADKAIEFLSAAQLIPDTQPMLVRHTNVQLPITNPLFLVAAGKGWFDGYYDFTTPGKAGYVNTLVSRVRLGEATGNKRVELVTVPGEATGPFGKMIRSKAGAPHTFLLGLTQNSLGYILPSDEFGRSDEQDGVNYGEEAGEYGQNAPGTAQDCFEQFPDCEAPPQPETPYEETVSLGPATAPLLENAGYTVLFNEALPPAPAPP